jgi:hypothetical protein
LMRDFNKGGCTYTYGEDISVHVTRPQSSSTMHTKHFRGPSKSNQHRI